MNSATLESITKELSTELVGRRFGKVFQLGRSEFAADLRIPDSRYLYIDLRPAEPAIFLINRRLRDMERSSGNPSPFALALKKHLSGAEVVSVNKPPGERVLEIHLTATDDFGETSPKLLIVQLTGKSANLFLTNEARVILDRARDTLGDGQQLGSIYSPPVRAELPAPERTTPSDAAVAAAPESPSEALDSFFAERAEKQKFDSLAASALAKITAEIRKREKLVRNLKSDLTAHGNAEEWKNIGDLLLANASTAVRDGGKVRVTDFYKDDLPEITIEVDENDSITEAAEKYYRRYTKARNAAAEIASRLEQVEAEVGQWQQRRIEVEQAIADGDASFLESLTGGGEGKRREPAGKRAKPAETNSAVRSFFSSDGFEILVGKKAKDNDTLTFKIAKSLDTWLHAADYPGSHVVIRNPNRKEIPQRTLLEAAQLAAFYSQGKAQTKAAVHHTQKKFVNKPKGAAPGLVSLAKFKTLLVEPNFPEGVRSE